MKKSLPPPIYLILIWIIVTLLFQVEVYGQQKTRTGKDKDIVYFNSFAGIGNDSSLSSAKLLINGNRITEDLQNGQRLDLDIWEYCENRGIFPSPQLVNTKVDIKQLLADTLHTISMGRNMFIQSKADFDNNTIINYGNNGFVGIGTDSPQSKLHIRSVENIAALRLEMEIDSEPPTIGSLWDITPVEHSGHEGLLNFYSLLSEKMVLTLTGSGKVGIGTEDPQEKLHVEGDIIADTVNAVKMNMDFVKCETLTVEGNSFLHGEVKIGNSLFLNGQDKTIWSSTDEIDFLNTSIITTGNIEASDITFTGDLKVSNIFSDEDLFIQSKSGYDHNTIINFDNEGFVGIGTESPDAKLHINSLNSSQGLIIDANATMDVIFEIRDPNDGTTFKVRGNGRVLSEESIHTKKNVDARNVMIQNNLGDYDDGLRIYMDDNERNAIRIRMSGVGDVFRVSGDGTVEAKTIYAQEIHLKESFGRQWPDYVFEEEYNLMSLNDLNNYIKTNKHLPGVPTEAQVKEEGMDLGEMNTILLKKIEELTLYIIEQNKRIEELEKLARE